MLTIGRAAAEAHVGIDTIRYYEREGLLRPARRTASGYRLYDEGALRRLRFIRQAQQCGFSLEEIRQLLELRSRDGACCEDVRHVAVEKKLQIERRIRALEAMSQALGRLIERCDDAARPLGDCPILGALEASLTGQPAKAAPRAAA